MKTWRLSPEAEFIISVAGIVLIVALLGFICYTIEGL